MSPDQATARYREQLGRVGEAVTLARIAGADRAAVEPTGPLLARLTRYAEDGSPYDLQAGERMVILLAADVVASGFPLPILPNADRIGAMGKALVVKAVDDGTCRVAGVTIAYLIKVAGA